jgi:hypothetical protein
VQHRADDFTVLRFSHGQWSKFVEKVHLGELPGIRKSQPLGDRWANPVEYHWERGDDSLLLSPPEVASLRESVRAGVFDLGGAV